MTALKLGGTEAKILTLTVVQEEEWQLCASENEIPEMPELPFKIPGVWAEDSPPPTGSELPPVAVKLKPRAILLVKTNTTFLARPKLGSKTIFTDS
jgi:hypothetical protein